MELRSEGGRDDERLFADEFATVMRGVPPVAGRILGLLLITNEPSLSSRDIMERLDTSHASISNMGRLLAEIGAVTRTVSPETRRDVFSLRLGRWADHPYEEWLRFAEKALKLLNEALASRSDEDIVSREKLTEMRDYYDFQCREIPKLAASFEKWRAARSATALSPEDTTRQMRQPAGTTSAASRTSRRPRPTR